MKTRAQTTSPRLTENEQQILFWLLHHPLQRIADVAAGLDLTISTTARNCSDLAQGRCGGQQGETSIERIET